MNTYISIVFRFFEFSHYQIANTRVAVLLASYPAKAFFT